MFILDSNDYCTWCLMTKLVIILFSISMLIFIFLPLSSSATLDRRKIIRSTTTSMQKPNITILMMFPDIDIFIPNLKSLLIVYEYIIQRYNISDWVNVNLQIQDSRCSISLAPYMLVRTMLTAMPDVVFGPFCGKYHDLDLIPLSSSAIYLSNL